DSVFTLYIDESTTPLVTAITPASDDSKYFRFGDGGGNTFGAVYDWFIWDTTGAYAPDEGAALPGNLSAASGTAPTSIFAGWDVFAADVLPSEAGWVESNATTGDDSTEILTLLDDPDITGNSVIRVNGQLKGADFKEMWKKEIGGDPAVGQTLVFRAVALDTSQFDRGIDVYLYGGSYRDRIFTRSTGIVEFDKADSTAVLDATKWHIYRLTAKDSVFNLYIDEATSPLVTAITPASDDSKYFRFGDGGSDLYGAVYDWFAWDTTGAYAPGEGADIPASLSTVTGTVSGVALELIANEALPEKFELSQNYPNPFNPTTQIRFNVATTAPVRLAVYDLTGRLVTTLVHDVKQPGAYRIEWNGRDRLGRSLSSGVYFYVLEAGDFRATKKMLLLK
ncbi:T9SS type A sorting domain-containing protein, partial [Candidatus Neomarinimicrobiota bacterium]